MNQLKKSIHPTNLDIITKLLDISSKNSSELINSYNPSIILI